MKRGTTLTLDCEISGIDLENVEALYITIKQPTVSITKDMSQLEISGNHVFMDLSQEETMKLKRGNCTIQARGKGIDNYAWATDIAVGDVESILYERII